MELEKPDKHSPAYLYRAQWREWAAYVPDRPALHDAITALGLDGELPPEGTLSPEALRVFKLIYTQMNNDRETRELIKALLPDEPATRTTIAVEPEPDEPEMPTPPDDLPDDF